MLESGRRDFLKLAAVAGAGTVVGGSGGAQRSNTGSLKQNALNLDDCIKNNAANYSIRGVLSLVGNTDISNAGVLDN